MTEIGQSVSVSYIYVSNTDYPRENNVNQNTSTIVTFEYWAHGVRQRAIAGAELGI